MPVSFQCVGRQRSLRAAAACAAKKAGQQADGYPLCLHFIYIWLRPSPLFGKGGCVAPQPLLPNLILFGFSFAEVSHPANLAFYFYVPSISDGLNTDLFDQSAQ